MSRKVNPALLPPLKLFKPAELFPEKSPLTRSKPMPVILASNGDVLVIVKLTVFVMELNVRLTDAVAKVPVEFPTIETVSALAVIVRPSTTKSAQPNMILEIILVNDFSMMSFRV